MTERAPWKNTTEALKDFIGNAPTAIYLMSGGVAKGKNVPYHSPSLLDPDITDGHKFGYLGGALRVQAVAHLHTHFPNAAIITSSTVNGISHAQVQERELRALWRKWDVSEPDHLIREERSNNTRSELAELIRLIEQNSWKGTILAMTSDWHITRTETTFAHLPELVVPEDPTFATVWKRFNENPAVGLVFRDAEPLLSIVDPRFKTVLDTVFIQEPWKSYRETRLAFEARGVKAIEQKTYSSQKVRDDN